MSIYPIITYCTTLLGGHMGLYILYCLQLLTFIASIYFLYKSLTLVLTNRKLIFLGAALYGLNINIIQLTIHPSPESFIISGIVFTIFLLINIIQGKATKTQLCLTPLLIVLLVFLLPQNILLYPILSIALLFAFSNKNFSYLKPSLISLLISVLSSALYISTYKNGITIEQTLYNPMHHTSPIFESKNNSQINESTPQTSHDIVKNESYNITHHISKNKTNIELPCKTSPNSIILNIEQSCFSRFPYSLHENSNLNKSLFMTVDLGKIYIFLALFITIECICYIRRFATKKSVHINICLISICITFIIYSLIAIQNSEYSKLMLPIFPCLCLLIPIFISRINLKLKA